MPSKEIPERFTVLVDGSNFAYRQRAPGQLDLPWLFKVLHTIEERFPSQDTEILLDNSTWTRAHPLDDFSQIQALQRQGRLFVSPPNSSSDAFLLAAARQKQAIVVTNDGFKDRRETRVGIPMLRVAELGDTPIPDDTFVIFNQRGEYDTMAVPKAAPAPRREVRTEEPQPRPVEPRPLPPASGLQEDAVLEAIRRSLTPDARVNLSYVMECLRKVFPGFDDRLEELEPGPARGRMVRFLSRHPGVVRLERHEGGVVWAELQPRRSGSGHPARPLPPRDPASTAVRSEGAEPVDGTLVDLLRTSSRPVHLSQLVQLLQSDAPFMDALARAEPGADKGRLRRYLERREDLYALEPTTSSLLVTLARHVPEGSFAEPDPEEAEPTEILHLGPEGQVPAEARRPLAERLHGGLMEMHAFEAVNLGEFFGRLTRAHPDLDQELQRHLPARRSGWLFKWLSAYPDLFAFERRLNDIPFVRALPPARWSQEDLEELLARRVISPEPADESPFSVPEDLAWDE